MPRSSPRRTVSAAHAFAQYFFDAALPPDVLNLVFGEPARIPSTLIASRVIRMITPTGSLHLGKQLSKHAGEAMKPVLMELGGHAPLGCVKERCTGRKGRTEGLDLYLISETILYCTAKG